MDDDHSKPLFRYSLAVPNTAVRSMNIHVYLKGVDFLSIGHTVRSGTGTYHSRHNFRFIRSFQRLTNLLLRCQHKVPVSTFSRFAILIINILNGAISIISVY